MSIEKFDAIVVGAGPAGATAAYIMSKAGLNVILLERGIYPGAKNMYGGAIYKWPIETIIPDFFKKAPIERIVTDHRLMILSKKSGLTLSYKDLGFTQPPYNAFITNRAKFDSWYANQAEKEGTLLLTSVNVTDVIRDKNKIIGVRIGSGSDNELYGNVVILADGANSKLAINSGLRKPLEPKDLALGVKEVIELENEKIESRFNLNKNEGVAIQILGVTNGMMGGGFLYTNKNSLSIGIVILLEHLIQSKMKPYELIDSLKNHPLIYPLIREGKSKEYSAHTLAEAGYYGIPKLYDNGVLIIGDAASLSSSLYQEGINMAIASGFYAGKTVIKAKEKKDYSSKTLFEYENILKSSYVFKVLFKFKDLPEIFRKNNRFFSLYPKIINQSLQEFMTMDGELKSVKRKKILKNIHRQIGINNLIHDLIKASKLLP